MRIATQHVVPVAVLVLVITMLMVGRAILSGRAGDIPSPVELRKAEAVREREPSHRSPVAKASPDAGESHSHLPSVVLNEALDVTERMKAVDALPKQQSPEAMIALRQLCKKRDEGEALRNNVANKLRECGEPNLVSDLTEMLWDENQTPKWRNYCVQHLRICYEKEPDSAVLETVFKATESDEKMVRICAVWSLARVATPRGEGKLPDKETLGKIQALALVALREKDTHFLITEAGVQSCARLGLTEALPEIRALAGNDDTKPML